MYDAPRILRDVDDACRFSALFFFAIFSRCFADAAITRYAITLMIRRAAMPRDATITPLITLSPPAPMLIFADAAMLFDACRAIDAADAMPLQA